VDGQGAGGEASAEAIVSAAIASEDAGAAS